MDFNNKIELIEAYTASKLPDKEVKAFEQELETNDELKSFVDLEQSLINGLKQSAFEDFKLELDGYHEEMLQEQQYNAKPSSSSPDIARDTELSINLQKLFQNLNRLDDNINLI